MCQRCYRDLYGRLRWRKLLDDKTDKGEVKTVARSAGIKNIRGGILRSYMIAIPARTKATENRYMDIRINFGQGGSIDGSLRRRD